MQHCAKCKHTKQACVLSEFSVLYSTIVDVGHMHWRVNCLKALLLQKDDVRCFAEVQASFLTEPVGSQQEEPETKQHGGSRAIVLQPPIFLLFDDPALVQSLAEDHRMVAGRLAKIRSVFACVHHSALHVQCLAEHAHA